MASAAATSVMGSVIGKLAALLTEKYKLAKDVKRGIRFLQEELSSMDAVLRMLAEKDDDKIDPCTKEWRSKVRELSYDIEDCVDCFMLNHSHGDSKVNLVHKAIRKVKMLFMDGETAEKVRELKIRVREQSERRDRYQQPVLTASSAQPEVPDPRALVLYQEARNLVGIDGPREEVIQLLKCEEKQHKVVSIHGIGGQGKTTIAMEVYRKMAEAFDSRAFVSVSQTPDMKKLLRDILFQISKSEFDRSEGLEMGQLILTVGECLKDKRYFILIDDIWSVPAWEAVRSALPENDNGSRIITTTRNTEVAKSCCTGIAAQMYEARPLSEKDSQRLFFRRLFGPSEDCPQDLIEVSNNILRKCGGLPLAIISIAGLLANSSKTLKVWGKVFKSISDAVDKDSHIDKMKRILLLSYFDLPQHLKSCLLYLSVFPEDYSIDCRQLILLWVAEGLIPGQDRESMEQLGRSYLNELINRSLVQPTKVGVDGPTVKQCRVHDIILEFIVSKAVEDNFVTIWNGDGFSKNYYSNKIRRLSVQKDNSAKAEEFAKAIKNPAHIRSISIFGSNSVLVQKHASEFLNSQVLRVLNIESEVNGEFNLGHVKSFGQLKYLRAGLPQGTEKLQHLETLDVRGTKLKNLPTCINQWQKLVRLFVFESVRLPDGVENLQALEELSSIHLGIQSAKVIRGLGDLNNLRVLGIFWRDSTKEEFHNGPFLFLHSRKNMELASSSTSIDMEGHKKACVSLLSKLFTRLQELRMRGDDLHATSLIMASCVPTLPPPLQKLLYLDIHNLIAMGPQISSLVNLTRLHINVYGEAGNEGINILASLPMLLSLTVILHYLRVRDSGILYTRRAIIRQGFRRLVKFNLICWRKASLEFEPGAMPKLQRLKLKMMARYQFKFGQGGLVLGLQNLGLGLECVTVDIDCHDAVADEVEALEDDIRGTTAVHPNCPILQIERKYQERMAHGCSRRPSDHARVEA